MAVREVQPLCCHNPVAVALATFAAEIGLDKRQANVALNNQHTHTQPHRARITAINSEKESKLERERASESEGEDSRKVEQTGK